MSTEVIVSEYPSCDVCLIDEHIKTEAHYDMRLKGTTMWAYVCEAHFKSRTEQKLGTGFGQKLIIGKICHEDDCVCGKCSGEDTALEAAERGIVKAETAYTE